MKEDKCAKCGSANIKYTRPWERGKKHFAEIKCLDCGKTDMISLDEPIKQAPKR